MSAYNPPINRIKLRDQTLKMTNTIRIHFARPESAAMSVYAFIDIGFRLNRSKWILMYT